MFGKLLNSVTWQVRTDLRRKLKANRDHKNLSWNLAERLQVYCSTHYIRAMLLLWGVAAGAVAVAHYACPVLIWSWRISSITLKCSTTGPAATVTSAASVWRPSNRPHCEDRTCLLSWGQST